ncbi:MAG TPA: ABC transporter ATP-binding protein [Phycisphaerae bacterium]|nr:ABC transporter ATP-binding protein [Phycisphaerae bacterium]
MSETPAIEIQSLTKLFGSNAALDGVDLSVPQGSVFGFLGPNGAGKTTTLRILTGLARPTSGRASILGQDVVHATNEVRSLIGFLPDAPGFYGWMSGREFLRFAGSLFGLQGAALEERVTVLLDMAGLADVRTRIGGYSRGMKQRLGIAQALINAPRLLLLDEPTSALDPIGRKEVLDMILSLSGRTTVFFSTHILADVERVCDSVAILNRGKVVMQDSVKGIKSRRGSRHVVVEVEGDPGRLEAMLRGEQCVDRLERTGDGLHVFASDLAAAQSVIPKAIVAAGTPLRRFEVLESSLEDAFVDLIGADTRP